MRDAVGAFVCLFLCGSPLIRANVPAVFVEGTPSVTRGRDWTVGFEFSVARPVVVTELGKADNNGNGFLDDPEPALVGIWDALTGDLLRSAAVAPETILDRGAFYSPIDPLTLDPGNYVVASQYFGDHEPVAFMGTNGSLQLVDGLERVRGRFETNSSFAEPQRQTNNHIAGPMFKIDEPLVMSQPQSWSVVQRDEKNLGSIPVSGILSDRADRVDARVLFNDGSTTEWTALSTEDGQFAGDVAAPAGGWYSVEVRAWSGSETLGSTIRDQVGVGDVYVIAGQSNSANHGLPVQRSVTGNVAAMNDRGKWDRANDPLPIATGSGGSPWPLLGDILATREHVPIGFVSVGWGGTRVDQWLPGGTLYPRLQNALQILGPGGAKAVLWHQGESDSVSNTTAENYADRLTRVIEQSRLDAGYDIPWGVAIASYLPATTIEQEQRVTAGQQLVIESDPLVFRGALTDDLLGRDWRYDDVHFNADGLVVHAQRWSESLRSYFVPEPVIHVWLGMFLLLGDRRTAAARVCSGPRSFPST